LEDNDTSEYLLTIEFNQDYPLFNLKKIFFQNESDFIRYFNLNNNLYESQIIELLSFLRFILFDDDMNILYKIIENNLNYNKEQLLSFYYIPPLNKDLEILVLKHLHSLCRKSLNKYPSTFEEDLYLLKDKNISFNLRNCLLLLMDEKTVLSYYIYFCEYCLDLFKLNSKIQILSKLSNDYEHKECQFEFYIQNVILKLIQD
jgi:hypothetical protein